MRSAWGMMTHTPRPVRLFHEHEYVGHGALSSGMGNAITAPWAVAFGTANLASGSGATVTGGTGNKASGVFSAVSGGFANVSSSNSTAVSGGVQNTASETESTVSGGFQNTATGQAS